MKIYAIRPGSIFYRFGIENGDYLVRLNGQPIDPTDEKLADLLRTAKRLSLEIERYGESLTIVIDIE